MFLKIFKHAFLRPLKTGIILGILSLVCALLSAILYNTYYSLIESQNFTVSILLVGSGLLLGVSNISVFAAFIIALAGFKKAVASDEAYLTYTLPATDKEQFWARFLALMTWFAIAIVLSNLSNYLYFVVIGAVNSKFWIQYLFVTITDFESFLINAHLLLLIIVLCVSIVSSFAFSILTAQSLSARFNEKIAGLILAGIYFLEIFVFASLFIILFSLTFGIGANTSFLWLWAYIIYFALTGFINVFFSRKIMGRWLNVV